MTQILSIFRRRVPAAFILLSVTLAAVSQSSNQNYILTKTMLDDSGSASFEKVDYYDGLGRPVETVLKKATPGQKDAVTYQEYDGAGRPSKSHIPVPATTSTGAYADLATVRTRSNSFYGDANAYDMTHYEASPLDRVTARYGPGAAWHNGGKGVMTGYYTNSTTGELSCALYAVASSSSLQRKGLYAAGELYVTKTTGEDGHVFYTFTDKLRRVVLERVMDGSMMNDTYYVHDNNGSLRYVLPRPPPSC